MPHSRLLLVLLAAVLITIAGCTKEAPPAVSTVAPSEHVASSAVGTTQNVLQKTFNLKGTATFSFEIPAHAFQPHLHGIFESFVGQVHGASDDSANVDFLILNDEQQSDFANSKESETMFSVEGAHNQSINFDLPASMNKPMKYYLVFRNPDGGKSSKVVEANFRVDF